MLLEAIRMAIGQSQAKSMSSPPNEDSELLAAAKCGDVSAQYELATRYRYGDGVPENSEASLNWYTKAAESRHPDAMNYLGSRLLTGVGCVADPSAAFRWYELAAKAGHATACDNLARCYLYGEGIDKDEKQAFYWFGEAARLGNMEALCELGTMFRFGLGVDQDIVAAGDLHLAAARNGVAAAETLLSEYLDDLHKVALSKNQTASRCLSEIYNIGAGAKKSMPLTWAWIKWAKESCRPSEDSDESAGVEQAYVFYINSLSADDREYGESVLKDLIAAHHRAGTTTDSGLTKDA